MRLGAADEQNLNKLHAGAHRVEAKVALYDGGKGKDDYGSVTEHGDLIDPAVEVSELSWSWTEEGFSGSLVLPLPETFDTDLKRNPPLIDPWGSRLRITIRITRDDGTRVEVPLPWAVVTRTVESRPQGTLDVTFEGLEVMLKQTQLLSARPLKKETDRKVDYWLKAFLEEASKDLSLPKHFKDPMDRIKKDENIPEGSKWEAGKTIWDAVQDIAVDAGGRLQFNTDGVLQVLPLLPGGDDALPGAGGSVKHPVGHIKTGGGDQGELHGNLISSTKTRSREGFANKVRVVLKDSEIPKAKNPVKTKPDTGTKPGTPGSPGSGTDSGNYNTTNPSQPIIRRYRYYDPTTGKYTYGSKMTGYGDNTGLYYPSPPHGYHGAWDIPADSGQAIYSPLNGRVAKVVSHRPEGTNSTKDLNYILIHAYSLDEVYPSWTSSTRPDGVKPVVKSGDKITLAFLHIRQNGAEVKEGDWVTAGDIVGHVGLSGRTNGYHLHMAVQTGWNSGYKQSPSWQGTSGDQSKTVFPPGGVWWQRNHSEEIGKYANSPYTLFSPSLLALKEGDTSQTNTPPVYVDKGREKWDGPMGRAALYVSEEMVNPKAGKGLKLARDILAIRSALTVQVDAETLCMPHLAPGDVIHYDDVAMTVGSVSCSLPFQSMQVSLREIREVVKP